MDGDAFRESHLGRAMIPAVKNNVIDSVTPISENSQFMSKVIFLPSQPL